MRCGWRASRRRRRSSVRRSFGRVDGSGSGLVLAPGRTPSSGDHDRSTGTSSRSCSSSASRSTCTPTRSAAEIQFGHVFRATHTNTSWEDAQFEICAQRFVHVGEPGYGVAVTNDSTYGYDAPRHSRGGGGTTTTVRQSLLRAPRTPTRTPTRASTCCRIAVRPAATHRRRGGGGLPDQPATPAWSAVITGHAAGSGQQPGRCGRGRQTGQRP